MNKIKHDISNTSQSLVWESEKFTLVIETSHGSFRRTGKNCLEKKPDKESNGKSDFKMNIQDVCGSYSNDYNENSKEASEVTHLLSNYD